ncbi:hypothetical protein LCGC14_2096410 [marine sediment metagenome]|uniref:DNA (cytosine-5-)-methyltransferase n=1 Tax=marine sediment metagenome TaxID=412755 RepID=A0A0F9EYJ8_9ZZZZ
MMTRARSLQTFSPIMVANESDSEGMVKPKLLDLFCGAGGASMGYHRAGFEVEGVDNKSQPHYPFKFYQVDALEFPLEGYDAYHASPPCQAYSKAFSMLIGHRKEHPDLVADTRNYLSVTGKPYVIENVVGAPMENYIQLEGTMFGLEVKKVRNFELHGFEILLLPAKPDNTRGWIKNGRLVGMMGHTCYPKERVSRQELETAYEINWGLSRHELRQAIPPAYTEYIGKELIKQMEAVH